MTTWLARHKALVATVAAALVAVSGVLSPPYSDYLYGAAVILAALSGGPRPTPPVERGRDGA